MMHGQKNIKLTQLQFIIIIIIIITIIIKCLSEAARYHILLHETLGELVSVAAQFPSAENVETSCK